ncbi:hypothetical protein GFL02_15130 [Pseudomonas stutzeri]|nr:hypothetical protein [Stutzerimonas frequens]
MGTTDLNGGALFNAEFGIRHRGSTVPERSGVALSFCRRHSQTNRPKNKSAPFFGRENKSVPFPRSKISLCQHSSFCVTESPLLLLDHQLFCVNIFISLSNA